MKAPSQSPERPVTVDSTASSKGGFTLVELLVVMAIVMILAAMLLPAVSRSKRKTYMTTCLNNLRQLAVGVKLYADDNGYRFPPKYIPRVDPANPDLRLDGVWTTQMTMGGPDAKPEWMDEQGEAPPAVYRPLYNYVAPSHVYRCPEDKGMPMSRLVPSNWETLGCSYQFNSGGLIWLDGGEPPAPFADWELELANKPESWVTEPTRHIMFSEPPPVIWTGSSTCFRRSGEGEGRWIQWHESMPKTEFKDPRLARSPFVSPIAFVDGHVARHDFTEVLTEHVQFPYVPTKDWIWYKPVKPLLSVE